MSGHPVPDVPRAGQESVWDYPRPPRVEPTSERLEVWLGGVLVAASNRSLRVLETSHPPAYYLPADDFVARRAARHRGFVVVRVQGRGNLFRRPRRGCRRAACRVDLPAARAPGFEVIAGLVAVMPGAMDRCTVDGEVVRAQEGGFYGGWITSRVAGPFKGGPGSWGW